MENLHTDVRVKGLKDMLELFSKTNKKSLLKQIAFGCEMAMRS